MKSGWQTINQSFLFETNVERPPYFDGITVQQKYVADAFMSLFINREIYTHTIFELFDINGFPKNPMSDVGTLTNPSSLWIMVQGMTCLEEPSSAWFTTLLSGLFPYSNTMYDRAHTSAFVASLKLLIPTASQEGIEFLLLPIKNTNYYLSTFQSSFLLCFKFFISIRHSFILSWNWTKNF